MASLGSHQTWNAHRQRRGEEEPKDEHGHILRDCYIAEDSHAVLVWDYTGDEGEHGLNTSISLKVYNTSRITYHFLR